MEAELIDPPRGTGHERALEYSTVDVSRFGYQEAEYFIRGRARCFPGDPHETGSLEARGKADYLSRILVRAPADPSSFSGTIVVEWLNVALGTDAGIVWVYSHTEMARAGHAWVGVSAEHRGVHQDPVGPDGRAGTNRALTSWDPQRYGMLRHPGDDYSYDIFTQAARLTARHAPEFFGCHAQILLATGASQAAWRLATYINVIHPQLPTFQGFLLQARPGPAAPLAGPGDDRPRIPGLLRVDSGAPVIVVQTESELASLGYRMARQPDGERLRVWEVAGAAHLDSYLRFGAAEDHGQCPPPRLAEVFTPGQSSRRRMMNCAPQRHYVANAAVARLDEWARGRRSPPHAAPLCLRADDPRSLETDSFGHCLGGVRTPWVEVPLFTASGIGRRRDERMVLFGMASWLQPSVRRHLYLDAQQYLEAFKAHAQETERAGFLQAADIPEITAIAEASYRLAPETE